MKLKNMLLLITLLGASNITLAQKANKVEKIAIKTKVDCNHCKRCETCGQKFETDLYYVKGIKMVEYQEKDTTIVINYNPKKINPEGIRTAISKLGYNADNVLADPKATAKLDDCCKK